MKKISIILTFFSFLIVFISCSEKKTYSQLQDEEQALIKDFLKRQNITVVTTMPKIGEWKENVYYKSSSGLYFHLIKPTSPSDTLNMSDYQKVKNNYEISYRSLEYTLTEKSDTINKWSTVYFEYPDVFVYGNYSSGSTGLQEAATYMRFLNSEAKIIVPHNLNEIDYLQVVEPRGYDIKITGIN